MHQGTDAGEWSIKNEVYVHNDAQFLSFFFLSFFVSVR